MSKTTLSQFIENYVNNKKIQNKPKSYQSYLEQIGKSDYDLKYLSKIEDLSYDRATGLSTYGAKAQSLTSKGLDDSGYAKYVDKLQRDLTKDSEKQMLAKMNSESRELRTDYAKYLQSYTEKKEKAKSDITAQLIKNGVIDTDKSKEYAISAGLSEEEALAVSNDVYNSLRSNVISALIDDVVSLRLNHDSARTVALSKGLNLADAISIENIAKKIREEFNNASDELLNDLNSSAGGKNTFTPFK